MNRQVVIFGTGNGSRQVISNLSITDEVVAVVDNDANRHNRFFMGYRIQSPRLLHEIEYDAIIIASMHYGSILTGLDKLKIPLEKIERGIPELREDLNPVCELETYNPCISIITPVHNRANCVAIAVRSVLDQIYNNFELLIVDDGSSDNTVEIVLSAANGDPRLRLIQTPHLGVSQARNAGLRIAEGEWIAYLDSDNRWHPEYLQRMISLFAAGRHSIGYCASNVFDNRRGVCYIRFSPYDRLRLERENYIDLNVMMHHRNLIDKHGPFDEAMTRLVDWDLVLRYTTDAVPFALKAALADYYIEPQLQRISDRESFLANYQIMKERSGLTTPVYSAGAGHDQHHLLGL